MSHSDNWHLILTTRSCSSYTNDVLALVNCHVKEEAWRQKKAETPPLLVYGGGPTSRETPQLAPQGKFYFYLFQINRLCFYDGKKKPDTNTQTLPTLIIF